MFKKVSSTFQKDTKLISQSLNSPKQKTCNLPLKGVMKSKTKLRAFSIQKKAPLTPVPVTKGPGAGSMYYFEFYSNLNEESKIMQFLHLLFLCHSVSQLYSKHYTLESRVYLKYLGVWQNFLCF